MKDIVIELTPENCEGNLRACFDEYIKRSNAVNLCNLLINIAKTELYNFNLSKIKLSFTRMLSWGCCYFGKDEIIINKKLLKKAKDKDYLFKAINTILHEIMHLKTEKNNNLAIENRNQDLPYFLPYNMENIRQLLYDYCYDEETALAGSFYYYFTNKNEKISRKYAHRKTVEYLKKYCTEYYLHDSFEESEQTLISCAYKLYPVLKYNLDTIKNDIMGYQSKFLDNFDGATEHQIDIFKSSLDIVQIPNLNTALINACVKTNNIKNVNCLLDTPLIRLKPQELKMINSSLSKYGQPINAYINEERDEKTIV